MAPTPEDKLQKLLEEFGVAMLVTRTHEGSLRARPMAFAEIEGDGTLWFITDRHSGKVEELKQDNHVAVTMQSSSKFISISGKASPVEDREKVSRLWRMEWKVWFPNGKDDPSILLLRVESATCEYWDNSGTSGIKYLIEAGKALLSGSKPDLHDDKKIHGKVSM